MGAVEAEAVALRDLREKCFAFDVILGCLTLPLLRSAPCEVATALFANFRTAVPRLVDDPAVDRTRVLGHITDFINQLDLVLKLEVPPDATPN
jgi:hypothetical protein